MVNDAALDAEAHLGWDAAVSLSVRDGRKPHPEHRADLRDVADELHREATLAEQSASALA